jgi:ribosomal protein S18 acetylase RimI-like enzyme
MTKFMEKGKDFSISNFHLSVRKDNFRAVKFYKKHGWQIDELHSQNSNTYSMKIINL